MTTPLDDFPVNLAASLAYDLITRGAAHLRDATFGDAESRALHRAWEAAFRTMLDDVAEELDEDQANLLDGLFRDFVRAEGVAEGLLDLALEGRAPDLAMLRERFNALGYDAVTLKVSFDVALTALTRGLADALLEAAMGPESPLYNRVSLVRVAAVHSLLREQRGTLETIAATVARLEAQLPASKYNLVFLGPASGFAIGDGATATVGASPDLLPLLERTLDLLTEIAAPRLPPPYTEADREAYLRGVIDACDTINLPYAQEGGATLPLERIYVALKADRSSAAERKASFDLFRRLAEEHKAAGRLDAQVLYRAMLLDPYAARYLVYDPRLRDQLLAAKQEETEKTYHLAEIVRRHRWIVLLGGPGSGKTTLARWLALQLARALRAGNEKVEIDADHVRPDAEEEAQETLGPARLPVLVRVADYAAQRWPEPGRDTGLPLRNYLGRHLKERLEPGRRTEALNALVRDYLIAGRVTFILDGLDEVTDLSQRQAIAAAIEDLIRDWVLDARGRSPLEPGYAPAWGGSAATGGGNQLIVTSRIVGYHLRPLHENLPHFVIQPMDDKAVRRFCQNWTGYHRIRERAEELAKAVLEHPNPNVKEQMARNPLLLTILAQVFMGDPEEGLPARRTELYRRAADAVFRQRETAWGRLAETLGGQYRVRVLARVTAYVAFHLHANPEYPAALVDAWQVRGWLRAAVREEPALRGARREDDVVDELLAAASRLSGFFVARGGGAYGFLPRQFQEYFAAWHLVAQVERGGWEPFLGYLSNPNWREVLLLAVGILEAAAAGALKEEGLTASPRAVARLLAAVLDAEDPTGGLLPHNLLLAANGLAGLERPPAEIVRRVAAGLIGAYRPDDEHRFVVLKERVERAFQALPRQIRGQDPAGEALCQALLSDAAGDAGRFTRMAAAKLVMGGKWYTAAVARALTQAWRTYVEPAGTILGALQAHYDAHPEHLTDLRLPFRTAVTGEPALWETVQAHGYWQAVARALYLAPEAGTTPQAVVRDSPLTPELLARLRRTPDDQAGLVAWLWEVWSGTDATTARGVAARDAGLALAHLGERGLAEHLAEGGENGALQRAIFAATSLALDLDRALDRALDLDRLREIDAIVARALERTRAEAASTGLIEILEQVQGRLAEWRALWTDASLPGFWLALGEALRAVDVPFSAWAADARPRLDAPRLAALDVARGGDEARNWPLLLPRLDGASLARLKDDDAVDARAVRERWLSLTDEESPAVGKAGGGLLARHAALLLAEMDHVTPRTVPLLCACLADPVDLTRYRAQLALDQERPASALGHETIEQMVRCYGCAGELEAVADCVATGDHGCWRCRTTEIAPHLADTYLDWTLKDIAHDRPEWLRAWAEAEETGVLGRVHRLDETTWPAFLELLTTASPAVQTALLDSASWLARLDRIPQDQVEAFTQALLALLECDTPDVRAGAVTALGQLREPSSAIIERLLALSTDHVSGLRFTIPWPAWPPAAKTHTGSRRSLAYATLCRTRAPRPPWCASSSRGLIRRWKTVRSSPP